MKAGFLLVLSVLTAACSHQARKVDCDQHLIAINPPTPLVKPDPETKKPTP